MDYGELNIELHHDNDNSYSFVGIHKNTKNELTFRLPLGYDKVKEEINGASISYEEKYEYVRDLHIKFYKLFKIFMNAVKPEKLKKQPVGFQTSSAQESDDGIFEAKEYDQGDVTYYRKFDTFDSLLDAYDPVRILALQYRLRIVSDEFDMRNFSRSLGGAVFLDDDSFYIDRDYQPRPTINLATTDIVGMYSFLLCDMLEHLYSDADTIPVSEEISVTADDFKARHLWPSASCWKPKQWKATKSTCKDILDKLHKHTAVKDDDYWNIYEAVERFLYDIPEQQPDQSENELWGLNNFWLVWEMLCFDYLLRCGEGQNGKGILYYDERIFGIFRGFRSGTQNEFQSYLGKKKYPDAIIKYIPCFNDVISVSDNNEYKDNIIAIALVDFKYIIKCEESVKKDSKGPQEKIYKEIYKQIDYREQLSNNAKEYYEVVSNVFLLPHSDKDDSAQEFIHETGKVEASFPIKYLPIDELITECIKSFEYKI